MQERTTHRVWQLIDGALCEAQTGIVREFPLKLTINGRELATLIGSPHQLNFLVAGFLRNQGFVRSADDIEVMAVCADFGVANVRIRGEVPERLHPTLTSGCGTGISYSLTPIPVAADEGRISPEGIFSLMAQLQQRAEAYRQHGGIHSAAVGDEAGVLLWAEDLGRHNTVDRIAGEALLKGNDLTGKTLVVSGRASSEMIVKASRLGIAVIASRTSPTDLAVKVAEEAGITLLGYVRAGRFNVHCHPGRILVGQRRLGGITGVILAGGGDRRMGCDKSLLPLGGSPMIARIHQVLTELFDEVLIVTDHPDHYRDLPCRVVPDLYPGMGALAGIHSGLVHASCESIFVVGCDMPGIVPEVIRHLCAQAHRGDLVLPVSAGGPDPLLALYHRSCLPAIEKVLAAGRRRVSHFFADVQLVEVPEAELRALDPTGRSFVNINTPEDYYRSQAGVRECDLQP